MYEDVNVQPEQELEGREATESAEKQDLQEATHEPGARIEQTQAYDQAEAIEGELTQAVERGEQVEVSPLPVPNLEPALSPDDVKQDAALTPDDVKLERKADLEQKPSPSPDPLAELAKDHPGTGGNVEEPVDPNDPSPPPDSALDRALTPDDVKIGAAGGDQVAGYKDPGQPPPPPDREGAPTLTPDDVKVELSGPGGEVAGHKEPGDPPPPPDSSGNIAATPINLPNPVLNQVEGSPGAGGSQVAATPINLPNPVLNQVESEPGQPGGNVAATPINLPNTPDDPPPPPDAGVDRALTPDDVKMPATDVRGGPGQPGGDVAATPINLPYTPENYDDLDAPAKNVVDIISKAIGDEAYKGALFADADSALAGYEVTADDRAGLAEMQPEAFDYFAAEVETRFNQALAESPDTMTAAAQQQLLNGVVHGVWRDLNPGTLAYVLAYKIPEKYL
jgi:hypothetical protein